MIKQLRRKPYILIAGIVLLVLAAVPLMVKSNFWLQIFVLVFLYSYWASCWNIIGGYAGQFALGNGLYIGVGAYTCGIFMLLGLSPWAAILVGGLISVGIAIAVSSLCFRLTGTYFALATVAFLYVARYIMLGNNMFFGVKTGGGLGMIIRWRGGIEYLQFTSKAPYYYIFLVLLITILLISYYIQNSKMGIYLSAIKTNQGAAATIGINVTRYKMIAQCISAFFLAVGGVFYAAYLNVVDPYTVLGYDLSLEIMLYVVIGGMGTLWGPVLGATVLTLLSQFLRMQFSASIAPLSLVTYGLILALIVRFAPGGVLGMFQSARKYMVEKRQKQKEVA